MLSRLRSLARAVLHRRRFEDEMEDELRFHLEAYAADLVAGGVDPAEAARRARIAFGGVERFKEESRQSRGLRWFDEFGQDVRFALRQMRRSPGVTAAALASLALGIGGTTAIFSLTDFVLLRSLPVAAPHELYFLGHGTGARPSLSSNYPLLERYQRRADVFAGVTAYNVQQFVVSGAAGPEIVDGQYVAGNYHAVLGVPFLLGRGFASESDRPGDGSFSAVISAAFWSRRFERDPAVVGKTLSVQNRRVTIVGVTAPGFHGLRPGTEFAVTLPLALKILDDPKYATMRDTWTSLNLVGRARPGLSEPQVLAGLDRVFQPFWMEPENAWSRGPSDPPHPARLAPAGRGTETLRSVYREPLSILMAMVALVLLVACGNVANLLYVRGAARTRELAVRLAIGAGRGRLVRQLLTESSLLGVAGGLLGLLVATWGTAAVGAIVSRGSTPILLDVAPNGRLLAFAAAMAAFTTLVFGLLPALKATNLDLTPSLRTGRGEGGGGRSATGRALVVCQVALSAVLLVGTGLLVRTLINLESIEAGFERRHILLFWFDARGSKADVMTLYQPLAERLRALPGVRAASVSTMSPLATNSEMRRIQIPGPPVDGRPPGAVNNRVTTDYFSTFDIPIVAGRSLGPQDVADAENVAVVNEAMARAHFGGANPVGRTFSFGSEPGVAVTIVGVARDARMFSLRDPVPPMVYVPLAQAREPQSLLTAALRVSPDAQGNGSAPPSPRTLERAARDAVRATSGDLVVSYVRTIDEQVTASLVRERLLATLSIAFGVVALLLASVGLYGVMSYRVTRRLREIGIRLALGASRRAVLWHVLAEALVISGAGIVVGLAAASLATTSVSTFVFGLTPTDPVTFAAVSTLLAAVSVVAGLLPARRAAQADPALTLKSE